MRRINTHSVLITVNFNYCLQCHFGADKSNICRIGQTVVIEKEGKKFLHVKNHDKKLFCYYAASQKKLGHKIKLVHVHTNLLRIIADEA